VISYVGEQLLERRTLHGAARVPAVVIARTDEFPAFAGLTPDIGLAGFTLGIDGIELLLQPFV
jgi:hypothetical protein